MNDIEGHQLKGECKRCGMCCSAISLPVSMKQIKEYQVVKDYIESGVIAYSDEQQTRIVDVLFVYLYWKQIPEHEAHKINPYLKTWGRLKNRKKRCFYLCSKFDQSTKTCTIHNCNPRVCNEFPWYGKEPEPRATFYQIDCGYKIDIL